MTNEEHNKDALVAKAVKAAFQVTEQAATTAKDVVATAVEAAQATRKDEREDDDRVTRALSTALRQVFGENEEKQRFVDVSRIPLICKHIDEIHTSMKEIKDQFGSFAIVKSIVFGFVGLLLVAFVGALFSLVFVK